MADNFAFTHLAAAFTYSASGAAFDQIPTTLTGAAAFNDGTVESVIIEGVVPAGFTGSGTLKIDVYGCNGTTTADLDARIDVKTEFRTPGAAEAMNVDNFDATPDSGTFTFSTTAYSLRKITITLTPAVTPVAGDHYRIKIERDADHATLDSVTGDLLVPKVVFREQA